MVSRQRVGFLWEFGKGWDGVVWDGVVWDGLLKVLPSLPTVPTLPPPPTIFGRGPPYLFLILQGLTLFCTGCSLALRQGLWGDRSLIAGDRACQASSPGRQVF
ncbi:MAG: hypothetical protein F6J93_24790 [Oscillatoria sp. SIO1A7]|nr:hypothetical protein [Oscillatoria sp. SIO1A7]